MQCSRYNKFYIVELDCYLAIGSFFVQVIGIKMLYNAKYKIY